VGQNQRSDPGAGIAEITVREAWQQLSDANALPKPVLIDVREEWEYVAGHAAGATHLPLSEFRERFREVPRDGDIMLICHVGERSMMAARFLRMNGYPQVANVEGGTEEWEAAHLPIERGAS
jgi:rhodanese-related sulfurtransferase